MKKLFLLLIAVFFSAFLSSQTVVIYHEDFELPSLGDSLLSSTDPIGGDPWAISTHLSNSGLRSDTSKVQDSKTTYLTTNSFSTMGYSYVSLKFAQICKLLIQDGGYLQYSTDGGNNWQMISSSYYRGGGVMAINKFNEYSYIPLWHGGDTMTMPDNNWWTQEAFDLSTLISNQADVKIRFCITDGGIVGGEGRYGWLIDDVKILASNNEVDPPLITLKDPILQDSVNNTGPFMVSAYITDASAIASASVIYNINGGSNFTIAMTNVSDSLYIGEIPSYTYNNIINYKLSATDQYANESSTATRSFIIKKAPLLVEIGNGTSNSYYAPIYVSSSSSSYTYSFNASIYTASEINTSGIIKSIAWNKSNTGGYNLSNATFKIYLKEVNNATAPTSYANYTTERAGATLVYSSLTQDIPTSTGWDTYNFNVDSFAYNSSNDLMVFVEWYRPGNATGAINYYYTSTSGMAYTFAGPSDPPAYSYSNYRPHIQLGLSTPNYLYDAGISEVSSPSGVIVTTTAVPVKVRVKNFGTEILSKATVHWSLDDVYKGSSIWTGSLAQDVVSSEFQLGTSVLSLGAHTIKAWTELPNDSTDAYNSNDTVWGSVYVCSQILSGTYTIGTSTSDFPTLDGALNGLINCGINGPVVFKIKPGTYNQQLSIPIINGGSDVNTITFESESGNNADVTIAYAASGSTDNWVVKIDGANYIRIKNITIDAQGSSYGRGVEVANGASYNLIEGCKIIMPSTTSSNYAGIYTANTLEQYNTYKNNEILNGYYGIYNYGSSTSVLEKGNVIEGNTLSGFYYYGIYSAYQDSVTINANTLENATNSTTVYGLYAYYNDNLVSVSKNKIHATGSSTTYPLRIYYCDNTAAQPGLISNNFISQSVGTTTTYGLTNYYSTYQNYYYNSVNITSSPSTYGAFYSTGGSNINLYNNIFCNTGGGYAYYISTTSAIDNSDHNDLYSTGSNLAYWGGAKADLPALQASSNMDANSISVDPGYISVTDLHVNNPLLNNIAMPLTEVTDDIDGDFRNASTPDIGADEFVLIANDGGITEMVSPVTACSGSLANVVFRLKNFGTDTLKTATVNWEINGIAQPSVNLTDTLANLETADVFCSTYTFMQGITYTIKAWVSNPNNVTDDNFSNDTLTIVNYKTSLSGTYTIGTTGADYATINLAVADLVQKGVCGPTVFNILPGTYSENVDIPEISGASDVNTITFQSSTGDSTSVIINYASTGSGDNFVIRLYGADYIIIKNLSIENTGGSYSRVIELSSSANHNQILNNVLTSSVSTSSTAAGIYNGSGLDEFNLFKNNVISNGYYGIYNYGSSTSALEKANVIEGNIIKDFYYYGVYSYYQDSVTIDGNTIENGANSSTVYSIYAYYNDNLLSISKNKIHTTGSGTTYPLRVYYCDNTAAQPGIIANNFISQSDGTATTYGLTNYYSTYQKYLYNSVNITDGGSTYGAFYSTGGSNVELYNNSFVNTGSGYAMYISTTAAIINSDYNNLYSTGSNFVYWGGAKADLTALQSTSGKDMHSVFVDPAYVGIKDLHTENPLLFGKALALTEVTDDIDGEVRNANTPCIGADEFVLLPNDAKVKALYTLGSLPKTAGSPHVVKAIIENRGLNTLYNLNVDLTISGSNTFNDVYLIDSIQSGTADTISFSGFSPLNFGSDNVKVSVPADDLLTNNELNYYQLVTDTVFAYADTSMNISNIGFANSSGILFTKYHINGNKTIESIDAYISDVNAVGKDLFAVFMKNGVIIDTSSVKTISANDINTWVRFDLINPPATTTSNNDFYAGIAQMANSNAYYPLGSQKEIPARTDAYFTADIDGSNMMQSTDKGRFMIKANLGVPNNNDAAVISILSPNSGCGLSSELVSISVQNKGTDTIYGGANTLSAYYGLMLNGNIINIVSQQITDTIAPAATLNFTFNVPVNVIAPTVDSTYHLISWVNLTNDPFAINDTLNKSFVVKYTPLAPVVNSVSIPYATSVTLTASSPDPMFWFDDMYSLTSIGQGAGFITPTMYAADTFYVAANTNISNLATIGNGTTANTGTTYPNPYGRYYTGNKDQYLLLASELSAQGFVAGPITELGFNVLTPGVPSASGSSPSNTYNKDYTISLGNTSVNALTSTFETGLTQVYYNPMYQEISGWNMHQFTTPFVWDGTSNLIVEVCMDKYVSGSDYSSPHAIVSQDATSFVSAINYHTDGSAMACPNLTGTTYSQRPDIKISGIVPGCSGPRAMAVVTVANIPVVDAGILNISSPVGSIPSGINTPVVATIKNWATNPLTSATIGWSIDGVLQTAVNWTGNLSSGQSVSYQIANTSFNGGVHTIDVWTYNPNGITDIYTMNDTASTTFSACMNGTFTIGVGKDFPTFNAALNTLDSAGICGNVVFLVDSGTYNERLLIKGITGMGPNSTVTFTSASGNNTDVVLHYATSSSAAWAMKFNDASYFTFDKMTLSVSGGNTYGRIMELANGSNHITISNCIIEGISIASSSNYYALIYANGNDLDNNSFINNVMLNGSYGIYLYGSSSLHNTNNKIIGNTVDGFYYYGIYSYYQDSVIISENTVRNGSASGTVYALYSYYNDNGTYTKNKINVNGSSTAYCMYFYYNNYNGGNSLVANNFISQSIGASGVYGLYNYSSNSMNYYHNSVNITGGSTSAYAFYSTSGLNNNVVNNILSNTGGGYAYYVSTPAGINISDYNDFFVSGTNLAYWSGAITDLQSLLAASNKDSNSVSVNPNYAGLTDLHIVNYNLDGKATPIAIVTDDIDGDVRNINIPDIGADEFNLPPNDAGIIAVYEPTSPVSTGSQNVKVILNNFGTNNLTSVTINWTVNGIAKTPFMWTGNLPLANADTVVIGNHNFNAGTSSIKVWTSLPNNLADAMAANDTAYSDVTSCSGPLAGNYTIGGSSANFQTINHAIQSLTYCGVNGAVTFNINPGNYNEQLSVPAINGASAINTITFKSANNDSNSVIINYEPLSGNDNYIVRLDGASYITFKNLSFVNNTQNNLGRVVELTNNANYNEFSNNVIQSVISTTSTTAGIYSYNTKDEYNTFANNLISGGYYGIYLYGISSSSKESGNTISNNIIKDFYYYGLYLYYQDSITVTGNTVMNGTNSGSAYGMYSYYSDNNNYQKNKIQLNNSGTTYGMYLYYNNNTSGNGLVANNFISQSVGTGTVYALYNYYSKNMELYYNSINVTKGGSSYGMYFSGGATNQVKNNSVVNTGGGYAIYASSTTAISASDFNNFYATGASLGYWSGACSDLSAWQTASMKDANSISMDPDYLSVNNLHVYSVALNDKGTVINNVADDIDGQSRSASLPDIGADEFTPLPYDIGVLSILSPNNDYSQVGNNVTVKCVIKNYGSMDVTNFNVSYKAGTANAVNMLYSATLLANTIDTITFVTPLTVTSGAFEIKAYTELNNDGNLSNDTSSIQYFGVPVKSLPYTENFDGSNNDWFQAGGAMQWQKGIPNANVINTAHSTPNVWTTVLNGNYADASVSYLYSPVFDNSILKADTLKFWMWMDAETDYDGGIIEYSSNGGADWDLLGGLATTDTNSENWYNGTSIVRWTGFTNTWVQAKYAVSKLVNLGSYIQFRFVFISDASTNNNGWAIDDFELTLKKIPTDAGVISISNPGSTSLLGDTVYPMITVKNYGLDPMTSIPVNYTINGQNPVSEIWNVNLAPGATATYTFNQYFKVLSQSSYKIKAYTSLAGDYYTGSDTTTKVVNVLPALKDVGILSIISPSDSVSSGSVVTVTVKIKNYGSTPLTSVPVSYQRGTLTPQNAVWTGTALNIGDEVTFSFPVTFTVPLGSSFTFSAYTSLAGDAYNLNDKISKSIVITSMPGNASAITSNAPFGGDTICFATGSVNSIPVTYNVAAIPNATAYIWSYSGNNVTYSDTTFTNSVVLTFSPNATGGVLKVYGSNASGVGNVSPDFAIDVLQNCTVGIENEIMDNFWLSQNMPNPASSFSVIEYNLPQNGEITFEIVNMVGQSIYYFRETKNSGKHTINLNVNDFANGIYYYSLTYKGKRLVNKMVVNK